MYEITDYIENNEEDILTVQNPTDSKQAITQFQLCIGIIFSTLFSCCYDVCKSSGVLVKIINHFQARQLEDASLAIRLRKFAMKNNWYLVYSLGYFSYVMQNSKNKKIYLFNSNHYLTALTFCSDPALFKNEYDSIVPSVSINGPQLCHNNYNSYLFLRNHFISISSNSVQIKTCQMLLCIYGKVMRKLIISSVIL